MSGSRTRKRLRPAPSASSRWRHRQCWITRSRKTSWPCAPAMTTARCTCGWRRAEEARALLGLLPQDHDAGIPRAAGSCTRSSARTMSVHRAQGAGDAGHHRHQCRGVPLMLAAGAGLAGASGTIGVRFGSNYRTADLERRALAPAHLGVRPLRHRPHRVQHVCAVLRRLMDRAPLWQRTVRGDLPVVGAVRQRGEQLVGCDARERRRLGRGVRRVWRAARVVRCGGAAIFRSTC